MPVSNVLSNCSDCYLSLSSPNFRGKYENPFRAALQFPSAHGTTVPTSDLSYKFSSRLYNFVGDQSSYCRGGTVGRHVGITLHTVKGAAAPCIRALILDLRAGKSLGILRVCKHERAKMCACGRYVPDNGRHPYGWRLGSTGNNGANFPLLPSILVGILYCGLMPICIYERYTPYMYIWLCVSTYVSALVLPKTFPSAYLYTSHTVSNQLSNQSGFKSIADRDGRYACAGTCVSNLQPRWLVLVSSLWLPSFCVYVRTFVPFFHINLTI